MNTRIHYGSSDGQEWSPERKRAFDAERRASLLRGMIEYVLPDLRSMAKERTYSPAANVRGGVRGCIAAGR